ncbi:MAG: hypothetical protein MI753_02165 [Hyphomicrobiales bacterium]|nr:hypothetical protein [Hyphomicrobiales bacterium]
MTGNPSPSNQGDSGFETDEPPLPPEQERIVRRMRRMVMASSAIMLFGFLIVFGAIGWRLSQSEEVSQSAAISPEAAVHLKDIDPSRIISASLDGDRVLLVVDSGSGSDPGAVLVVLDVETGTVLRTLPLGQAAGD